MSGRARSRARRSRYGAGGRSTTSPTSPSPAREIRRLDEQWLRARELAIDGALAAGDHRKVLSELDELVAAHPLREGIHAQRMLALYRSGRQADALEAYRHARGVLVREAGVEPGPELRRLHAAILDQDPSLDLPASRSAPARAGGRCAAGAPSPSWRRCSSPRRSSRWSSSRAAPTRRRPPCPPTRSPSSIPLRTSWPGRSRWTRARARSRPAPAASWC